MKKYLKRTKLKTQSDAAVDRSTISLSEPMKGKRTKPGEAGVELGEMLQEQKTSDPAKLKEIEEEKKSKEQTLLEEMNDIDAKLQTMLLYYKSKQIVTPELKDLVDTLYSVYITDNTEEAEDLEFEAKYRGGQPVRDLFDSYFFSNIDAILSSYDNLRHGIYTLKVDYPTQLSRLKHGI